MSHPYYHAKSSAARFGGTAEDYVEIHEWFDQTKAHMPDGRHRAVLHSSFGIYLAQQMFGEVLTRPSDGRVTPVRLIGEQHVLEDLGFVPTLQDWLRLLQPEPWMTINTTRLSQQFKHVADVKPQRRPSRSPAARQARRASAVKKSNADVTKKRDPWRHAAPNSGAAGRARIKKSRTSTSPSKPMPFRRR